MDDFKRVKESVSLKDYAESELEKTRGGYICPNCSSGTGANKSPAFSIKGEKWKCFACDAGGDVFDLAGYVHGLTSDGEKLETVAAWAGIPLERKGGGAAAPRNRTAKQEKGAQARQQKKATDTPKTDYTAGRERHRLYIAECAQRLRDNPTDEVISYLSARGISYDDAVMLGLGYDPNHSRKWQDNAGNWRSGTRLVIPWAGSDYYHADRVVSDDVAKIKYDFPPSEPDESKGIKPQDCVGEKPLYNPQAFERDYIIVVEGAFDAIAIQLCGYNALAVGGTAVDRFANEAVARGYKGTVVDMLDADGDANDVKNGKGRRAGKKLVSLMEDCGIPCLSRSDYGMGEGDEYGGKFKDAGDWFAADRADLADLLFVISGMAQEKAERAKVSEYADVAKALKIQDPADIANDIFNCAGEEQPSSTGFMSLDNVTNGGLRSGLITMGAVSSAGKTTFFIQVADFIAANGRPVLFVTIEQSGRELVAKSISRLMAKNGYKAVTLFEMGSSKYRPYGSELKETALRKSIEEYRETIAPNLVIMAADEQPTVAQITKAAKAVADRYGQPPVVMVDYLQLLAPLNERNSDKQTADQNVSRLRMIARDLKSPVMVISSLNRSSYNNGIEMSSFKESGMIEYGSDLLLGLQPRNMKQILNAKTEDGKLPNQMLKDLRAELLIDSYRRKPVKEGEIVVLKNRNGSLPEEPLPLTFYAASSFFVEK